jgi:hypothetical protein
MCLRFCFDGIIYINMMPLGNREEEATKDLLLKSTTLSFGESFLYDNEIADNYTDDAGTVILEVADDVASDNLGALLELSNVSMDAYMRSMYLLTKLTITFFFFW